jgi:hypothetical protein
MEMKKEEINHKQHRLKFCFWSLIFGFSILTCGVIFNQYLLIFVGLIGQAVPIFKLPTPSFKEKRHLVGSDVYWFMGIFGFIEIVVLLAFLGGIK